MLNPGKNGERYDLFSPTALPKASTFLWNKKMMIQVNCRGYAVSQFLQPEPAKYVHAPNLEAKTFMQPEQPFYAHHPGRFFYIKDEENKDLFSIPFEPIRAKFDYFKFSAGKSDVKWKIRYKNLLIKLKLTLPKDDCLELWTFTIQNQSKHQKRLSIYTYFPVGYMSWMNQSGKYNSDLQTIVCSSVTPYQKLEDYFVNKYLKDKTFLLAEKKPVAWEVNQETFEGEGGLHNPTAIQNEKLACGNALYEMPTCVMQYRLTLNQNKRQKFRFVFGPASDEIEISSIREKYFNKNYFRETQQQYTEYINSGKGCLQIETPDANFDNFVNHWLPRQIFYHGDVNRLTTDPQTRNYLQDAMGMSYIKPEVTRNALITALCQQHSNGAMPDGILLLENAKLKFINQIPHTDHCVWLPICLQAYLDETNDYELLNKKLKFSDTDEKVTFYKHIELAMKWLQNARDERGLSFIKQGDWCDPMNMVGYKGKGVSAWLSVATAYAFNVWAEICDNFNKTDSADYFRKESKLINKSVNKHLWNGNWYGRGITDDNVIFGVQTDREGKIFLNPQSWAILGKTASKKKQHLIIDSVEKHLETPFGLEMLTPAFTQMREDIGRVTQKFPGSAENGSIYNHASTFYIYSLYSINEFERAFKYLQQLIPGPEQSDYIQRGQLPVFIPNYYRGAYKSLPRTAGRSSQLFNTGTIHWFYRSLIDGLFGLKGTPQGLSISPQIPKEWKNVKLRRSFRGAYFHFNYLRDSKMKELQIFLNNEQISKPLITNIVEGKTYKIDVIMPD